MAEAKTNRMGSEPVLKLLISMSLPAMFSMMVQAMYNIIDSMFVSWLGEEALTAVSLGFPIQMLIISIGVGTGVGLNSVISRRLGEKNQEKANLAASHGFFLAAITAVAFAIFGALTTGPFFRAFTTDASIISMGSSYLYIVTIFSFGSFIHIAMEKTLQATGNMFYPMMFQLLGAITNIILDPILIFGLFGAPALGVTGAAIATVIGQILAMSFSIYVVVTKSHGVHIQFKGFRFDRETVRSIYAVGIPAMVMQSISSVLMTFLNMILISYSATAVSVYGIYNKIQSFVFMPIFGLTQGLMPIMGYNYGSRRKDRLMQALKLGEALAIGMSIVGMLIFLTSPQALMSIFQASEGQLEIGMVAFRILSISFPLAACSIVMSTMFQALGSGVYSLIMSVLRQLVLILPIAYGISLFAPLDYVWWAMPIAEGISCLVAFTMLHRIYKNKISMIEAEIAQ